MVCTPAYRKLCLANLLVILNLTLGAFKVKGGSIIFKESNLTHQFLRFGMFNQPMYELVSCESFGEFELKLGRLLHDHVMQI